MCLNGWTLVKLPLYYIKSIMCIYSYKDFAEHHLNKGRAPKLDYIGQWAGKSYRNLLCQSSGLWNVFHQRRKYNRSCFVSHLQFSTVIVDVHHEWQNYAAGTDPAASDASSIIDACRNKRHNTLTGSVWCLNQIYLKPLIFLSLRLQ